MTEGKTWLVFGDDWGRHPSTTQHLISHLPPTDTVYWIGSIGMRAPSISWADAVRVVGKLQALLRRQATNEKAQAADRTPQLLKLLMLPWHGWGWARRLNLLLLQRALKRQLAPASFDVVLVSNPVAVNYLPAIRHRWLGYLRLDDYAHLPGVDAGWMASFEPSMVSAADCNFATAQGLLPGTGKDVYLPQGVDVQRFASVPNNPPTGRCIGFFGLMESWLDYALIAQVARAHPDWTFEFIGHAPAWPAPLDEIANIRLLPAVDYQDLALAITHWSGAWVPFLINRLTLAVNPIKLREYLAAGLPTFSTPLPESRLLQPWASIGADVDDVSRWLKGEVLGDTADKRQARKQEMQSNSWQARALQLRECLCKETAT